MNLGIGTDLCRIDRIRRSIDRFGKAWLDEVFTDHEQIELYISDDIYVAASLCFAVKEACSKAIGTGFAFGVSRRDFEVSLSQGGPSVRLHDSAAERACNLCPGGSGYNFQLEAKKDTKWVLAMALLYVGERVTSDQQHLISEFQSLLSSARCLHLSVIKCYG